MRRPISYAKLPKKETKIGLNRDLNPGPVTSSINKMKGYFQSPEATIIPLDH
jgi:hypothetical protein